MSNLDKITDEIKAEYETETLNEKPTVETTTENERWRKRQNGQSAKSRFEHDFKRRQNQTFVQTATQQTEKQV